jgi:hypothetical protein
VIVMKAVTVDMHSASGLRRWAMRCAAAADDPRASDGERERLLTIRRALLELADAQDWLDGRHYERAVIKLSA